MPTLFYDCWGQNRLRRNQRQKTSRANLLFHKNRKKSKNEKNYQRSNGQLVKTDELDRPRDSAQPFAELDQSSSAVRQAGSTTDSARPFAELDQSSSANGRAELTRIHLHIVLVTPLPRLYQTRSCFVSIGGIVGTLRFKNRKNSFSRITFGLIV